MIQLRTRVTGMEAVKAEFDLTEDRSRDRMKAAVERATSRALEIAQANVTGGVLNRHTGRLAESLGAQFRESKDSVYGKLGTDWYIGRFWEKGFRGQQAVKAHFRSIKKGSRFELRTVSRRGKVRVARTFATGATAVPAYERTMNGSPRPWLMPALDAVRDSFRRDMVAIARNPNGS